MQCPASHGNGTKPFAQITSLPSLFNSSGRAAFKATGLRDKCVNDYSPGVGSSPYRSITLALFLSRLLLFLCFLLSSAPTHSLTPLLLKWPMFNLRFPTCHWPVGVFSTKPAGSGSASHNWAAFVYTVVRTVYCQLNIVDMFPNMTSLFCFTLNSIEFWHFYL